MGRFFRILSAALVLCAAPLELLAADTITCWFPPTWKAKAEQAKAITEGLSQRTGLTIVPKVAPYYPEIVETFDHGDPCLVYVGSFVQAILKAKGKGVALVQAIDGQERYGALMVFPKGKDPAAILRDTPAEIAFAVGASSGESGAKAATGGKASVQVADHGKAATAVKAGNAKAAFVKNWWWEANKAKFPELDAYEVPGVSDPKNPDNVLTASVTVPEADLKKIAEAALTMAKEFGAPKMAPFDPASLEFTLELMRKAGIDPAAYTWH